MKTKKLIIFIIFSLFLIGCDINNPKYINLKKKESIDYYSNEIYFKILNNEDYTLTMFDTDVSKNTLIDKEEQVIIENFLSSLTSSNYLKNSDDISNKEAFHLIIEFDDSKYIFNVYDENLVTVYPWDGVFPEDIITSENVPLRYNLYDFCNHIKNRSKLSG
ncbi:MAG: DUF4883 family protein [Clostridium sp.]|nr:DUF4883 family protein [Clostridium sp.]MCI7443295.1 DUF4883 family protein [Clostridium sp.]